MPRTRHLRPATILALMLASAAVPAAAQDWALSHGPFTTAADVRPHNALPQDIADILDAIDAEPPAWGEALEIFAFGRNFPWREATHSLGRFTDDYNGTMPQVVPLSVGFFGDPTFQKDFLFSALAGTRQFQDASDAARRAAFEAGAVAAVANWTRFELATSEAKALAAEPNWALTNGSPKNWNEIFAFHWGPEGRHSVHAALAGIDGGPATNEALLAALAEGQEPLLREEWPAETAAEVAALIDRGTLLLLHDALARAADAPGAEFDAARAAAAGAWLAGAEPVLAADPDLAERIAAALTGAPDPFALDDARNGVAALLSTMTDS
jgi:hypothetical protein